MLNRGDWPPEIKREFSVPACDQSVRERSKCGGLKASRRFQVETLLPRQAPDCCRPHSPCQWFPEQCCDCLFGIAGGEVFSTKRLYLVVIPRPLARVERGRPAGTKLPRSFHG